MNKFEEAICNLAYFYEDYYNGYPFDLERVMYEHHDDFMTLISLEQAIRFGYARIVIDYTGGENND